jgi:hypothetical protein
MRFVMLFVCFDQNITPPKRGASKQGGDVEMARIGKAAWIRSFVSVSSQ